MDASYNPLSCFECCDPEPYKTPLWIKEGGLGEDTIKFYEQLDRHHEATITDDDKLQDFVDANRSILGIHAHRLRPLAEDDEAEVFYERASRLGEIHRLCAEFVNALSKQVESPGSSEDPPPDSRCLDSKLHEIPVWTGEGGLITQLYERLDRYRDATVIDDDKLQDFIETCWSILGSHARGLLSFVGDDKGADARASLVKEMRRLCRMPSLNERKVQKAPRILSPAPGVSIPNLIRFLRYAYRVNNLLSSFTFAFGFQWILKERLGNLYGLIDSGDVNLTAYYAASDDARSLADLYQEILKEYAKMLRFPPDDASDEGIDKPVPTEANLTGEMHRLCAKIVNDLSERAKSSEVDPFEKLVYYSEIANTHRIMWNYLRGIGNPPELSTGDHGYHMKAADHFYKKTHAFAVNNIEKIVHVDNFIILHIAYSRAKFIWDAHQHPVEPRRILYFGIRSAEIHLERSQCTCPSKVEFLRKLCRRYEEWALTEEGSTTAVVV